MAGTVLGLIGLIMGFVVITTIPIISQSFNQTYTNLNLTPNVAVQHLSADLLGFGYFFPELAVLGTILAIASSFILSFFIKTHPLSAVFSIALLVIYTMAAFYISNALVGLATLSVWSGIIGSANILLLFWLNLPYILVFASVVDLAIGFLAARN